MSDFRMFSHAVVGALPPDDGAPGKITLKVGVQWCDVAAGGLDVDQARKLANELNAAADIASGARACRDEARTERPRYRPTHLLDNSLPAIVWQDVPSARETPPQWVRDRRELAHTREWQWAVATLDTDGTIIGSLILSRDDFAKGVTPYREAAE